MHIKGILTDFDGVLLDTFRDGTRRIQALCAIHSLPFTRETRQKLFTNWGMPGVKLLT
ncbi:HAD family hydrolase, partial [Candidatus Kaiserbacteria bacterium]|nr:HAD family hydrolase [Candidatus Kaiserbacteria bacterium]